MEQFDPLLQRWEQAFDDLQRITGYKAEIQTVRYADGPRFDLKKFDWANFPSSGALSDDKDGIDDNSLYEYGFNAEGLPCYVTFHHNFNNITWEGYYSYSKNLVEYVEYCVSTGVPSAVTRVVFEDEKKLALESVMVNTKGSMYSVSQTSREAVISKIKNDEHALFLTVTHYAHNAAGQIEKAASIHVSPGIGKFTSSDEYTYDHNQALDSIRTFYDNGTSGLTYSRIPEDLDPDTLIADLAAALAASIADGLAAKPPQLPVALLELSYHLMDNYMPLVVCQSEQEVERKLIENEPVFLNDYNHLREFETTSFEHRFAQLQQIMEENDDWDPGTNMLRKAASLLTKSKLFGKLPVTEDFAAYAIDWSIEGQSDDDFQEILLECGVEAETVVLWQEMGKLP